MVIRSVEFLGPMASPGGWRPASALPEIAFAGRSNVGKSSLLNTLVRRKKLARVSHTPGRTREINFFAINGQFTLVDLPGYGYARISKERKAEWRPLIEGYLTSSAAL
ncbi:MAG: ribosome biogenesis GTP-binding protein YsxC, partial [Gemmatimonadota bacterium]|nr:ribosome biogenesis GTP-binding protein YsxC [Gemmatimonadota bacterium]